MPEGHTIRFAAEKLAPLVGQAVQVEAPQARHRLSGLRELDGRVLERVEPRGKHLLLRFEGGRTVHSHLRMSGAWDVYREGQRWRRPPATAWLVLRAGGLVAVEFSGPVLEVLDDARLRLHPALRSLGPDVLDDAFDPQVAVARVRAGYAREAGTIGEALLQQSLVCGVGNMFKSEILWACRIDPWAPLERLSDEEIAAVYREAQRQLRAAVAAGREPVKHIYRRDACPCCLGPTRYRAQGDDGRATWWCPVCQRSRVPL